MAGSYFLSARYDGEAAWVSQRSRRARQSEPVSDVFGADQEPVSYGFDLGTKQEASSGRNNTKLIKAAVRLSLSLSVAVRLPPFMWDCSSFPPSPRPCLPRVAVIRGCGGIPGRNPRIFTRGGLVKDGSRRDNDETAILKALTPLQAPACLTRS